jgi:hypothetical protein
MKAGLAVCDLPPQQTTLTNRTITDGHSVGRPIERHCMRAAGEENSWAPVTRSDRKLVDKATAAGEHSGEATPGSLGNISG